MKRKIRTVTGLAVFAFCSVFSFSSAFAADTVSLVWGPLIRTVETKELQILAQTMKPLGVTADILRVANISPKQAAEALRFQYGLDVIFVSNIIDAPLATHLFSTLGKIVHPRHSGTKYAVPALRSAIILSLVDDNLLSPLEVIEKYPVEVVLDLQELFTLFEQAKNPEDLARVLGSQP
jgi:hypothetical protein